MLDALVDDLKTLESGFRFQGQVWRLIVIGVKGDMPFVAKAAKLLRHWLRNPRKEKTTAADLAKLPGVCHLCMAGTAIDGEYCPYEDVNLDAVWTKVPNTTPWEEDPCFLKLMHIPASPWKMFKNDIFHNFHGGSGMYFISSSLVECFALVDGTIPEKFLYVNQKLKEWAALPGNHLPHSGDFTKERICFTSMQQQPDAGWSKFDDTRVYMAFLEWFLKSDGRQEQCQRNEILRLILVATEAMNKSMSLLYSHGLWLESKVAFEVGRLGRLYLKCYSKLAFECHTNGKLRYPQVVKNHALDHQYRRLIENSRNPWTLTLLSEAVQADEDAINLF